MITKLEELVLFKKLPIVEFVGMQMLAESSEEGNFTWFKMVNGKYVLFKVQ